jgi:hypothetical protein
MSVRRRASRPATAATAAATPNNVQTRPLSNGGPLAGRPERQSNQILCAEARPCPPRPAPELFSIDFTFFANRRREKPARMRLLMGALNSLA